MAKMQMSTSQMQAVCRNRNVQKNLTEKLEQLDHVAFQSKDAIHQEMKTWRKFRRENVKNSGWSPKSLRPDPGEDMFSPSSVRSSTPSSPTQAKEAFAKPWAYTYSQVSHNKIYKELAQASQSSEKALDLSLKTMSSPIVANTGDKTKQTGDPPAMLKHVEAFRRVNRAASFLKPKEKLLTLRQKQDTNNMRTTDNGDDNGTQETSEGTTFAAAVTRLQKINQFNAGCKLSKEDVAIDPQPSTSKKLARTLSVVKGISKFRNADACSKCGGTTDNADQGERFAQVALTYKGLHRAQSVLKLQTLHTEENVNSQPPEEKSWTRKCSCNCKEKRRPISKIWKDPKEVVEKNAGDKNKSSGIKGRSRIVSNAPKRSSVSNLSEAKVRQIQAVKEKVSKCFEINTREDTAQSEKAQSETDYKLISAPKTSIDGAGLVKSNKKSGVSSETHNEIANDGGENLPPQNKEINGNEQARCLSQAVNTFKKNRETFPGEFKHNFIRRQRTVHNTIAEESCLPPSGKNEDEINGSITNAAPKDVNVNNSMSDKGRERTRKTSTGKRNVSSNNGEHNKNNDNNSEVNAYNTSCVEGKTSGGVEKACSSQDFVVDTQPINEEVIKQIQEKVFKEFGKNLRQNSSAMLRKFSAVSRVSTVFQAGGHRRKRGYKNSGVNIFTKIAKYMLFRLWQRRREKQEVEKREESTCSAFSMQTDHVTKRESIASTHCRTNSCERDDSLFDSMREICGQNGTYTDHVSIVQRAQREGRPDAVQLSDKARVNNLSVNNFLVAECGNIVSNTLSQFEEASKSKLKNQTLSGDKVHSSNINTTVHKKHDTYGNKKLVSGRDKHTSDYKNNNTIYPDYNGNNDWKERENDNNNNFTQQHQNKWNDKTDTNTNSNHPTDNTVKNIGNGNLGTPYFHLHNMPQSPESSSNSGTATKSERGQNKIVLPPPVYHRGVRLFNYVSPEKRYLSSKQAKVRKDLSVRWHSAVGAMVNKHEISDEPSLAERTLPKQARDRALNKMIEANHTPPPDDTLKLQNEALRSRVQDFLESVKPYKQQCL